MIISCISCLLSNNLLWGKNDEIRRDTTATPSDEVTGSDLSNSLSKVTLLLQLLLLLCPFITVVLFLYCHINYQVTRHDALLSFRPTP